MSNCFLKKLAVCTGRLMPAFDRTHHEYVVSLGTHETKTTIEAVPEMHADSIRILVASEEQTNQININEGCIKTVEIIVNSEFKDRSRTYILQIYRLSSKAAFLENISICPGKLIPPFHQHKSHYICNLGSNIAYIKLHCVLPDERCIILINKEDPKSTYDLNIGNTTFKIKVFSLDESQSKKYLIEVKKKEIPRYIFITDPINRFKYEDPISLSPIYCTKRIVDFDIWPTISSSLFNQLERQRRLHFGKGLFEHVTYTIFNDIKHDKTLSELKGKIPFTYGGLSDEYKLTNIGSSLLKSTEISPFKPMKLNSISTFTHSHDLIPEWQKDFEIITEVEETENAECDKSALEESLLEYFFCLPFPTHENYTLHSEVHISMKKLIKIISTVTKMLKNNVKKSDLHLLLGLLLEEKFIIEDTLDIKPDLLKKKNSMFEFFDSPNQRTINELCAKVGFTKSPTLSQQLKSLIDEQSYYNSKYMEREADNIQNLYEWKMKQASVNGKMAILVTDKRNDLGKAAIKYFTALQLDPSSAIKHYHAARMMMFEGNYCDAILRLENALTLNPDHLPSKFLLGLAYSNLTKITGITLDRSIELLLDGLEEATYLFSKYSILGETEMRKLSIKLKADDKSFFRIENPFICRGILALGKLLLKKESFNIYIKPLHVLHTALHIASLGWSRLSTGFIISQFEYVIIECHEELLNIINDEIQDVPTEVIVKRCERINSFISGSLLPTTQKLIDIQEKICRILVFYQPCNEYYLINLGMVILKKADMFPFKHLKYSENIRHAIHTFRTALEMNEKPIIGLPSPYLEGLSWFKNHKLNFLRKKVPNVICESFRLVENDDPIIHSTNNIKENTNIFRSGSITNIFTRQSSGRYGSRMLTLKSQSDIDGKKIHSNTTCSDYKMRMNGPYSLNLNKPLTSKQLLSKRTSLFQTCRKLKAVKHDNQHYKTDIPALTIMINPPTLYSRLMLARTFRANHQYIEALKYFNFIRKVTHFMTLKAKVNREMMECLLECENFKKALEFISKLHVTESKISHEDILLFLEVIKSLIKMSCFHDERLEKYCLLVAKYDGLNSIKEILLKNNLKNLYSKIVEKIN